jgi:hypothetical protein
MPRKMKAAALGIGVASLLLGASPAWAAEYTYDGSGASGTAYNTSTGPGSQGSGTYIGAQNPYTNNWDGTSGTQWFSDTSFIGNSSIGVWRPGSGNRLIIDYTGGAPVFVFGGVANYTSSDIISGNEVHYSGGSGGSADILVGGVSHYGSANDNKVYYYGGGLDGFNIYSDLYAIVGGAAVGDGVATAIHPHAIGNIVVITGADAITGKVIGGAVIDENSHDSQAKDNTVTIESGFTGTITGDVIGGSINPIDESTAIVSGNRVIIAGGTIVGAVYGNYSSAGAVDGENENSSASNPKIAVDITGGMVNGSVRGGASYNDTSVVANNTVRISGVAHVTGNVYGAETVAAGSVTGNIVKVQGDAQVDQAVYGGHAHSGDVSGNKVLITGGSVGNIVVGGYADTAGTASGNEVLIENGTANSNVVGGRGTNGGTADNNKVTLLAGAVVGDTVMGGWVQSGNGDTSKNTVLIDGGTVTSNVSGGHNAGGGMADGNTVILRTGTVGGSISGGDVFSGEASENKVLIYGGTVGGVLGAQIYGSGMATENQVFIYGGAINGNVSGAYLQDSGGVANNNTVTLTGAITLSGSGGLYGYSGAGTGAGNTLNVYDLTQNGNWNTVANFDQYNFGIKHANVNDSGKFALVANSVTMGSATIGSIEIIGGAKLAGGDEVGLIDASGGGLSSTVYTATATTVKGLQGVSTLYDFDVVSDGNKLTATVASSQANPGTKALSEGWLSGPAFLNQGADLLEKEAVKEAGVQAWREQGPAVFAAMGYSDARHDTGSHVDVKGPSLVVGLANAKETAKGTRLTYGGFLEAGWGSYDSYNSFSSIGEVRGEGDTSYYGLGILARADHAKRGAGRIYTEGSLRIGQVKTDFDSDLGNPGTNARYDAKAVYYGLHLGVGYIRELKGDASLDLYTKLLYTRTGSDSLNVLGDPVELDAVSSVRWRAGVRYSKAMGDKNEFYAGLAYDHEFDGKAKGTANGSAIDAPDLKGGTGIGELGVVFKGKNSLVDIKLEGYTGKREGFGGGVQFKWFF